jgi:hypothetical protein
LIDATCATVTTVYGALVHFACATIPLSVSPALTVCVWQSALENAAHEASVVGGAEGAAVAPPTGGFIVVPGHARVAAEEDPQSHVKSLNAH